MSAEKRIYCTSFCNHGHDLETGRPIGHECYIIPARLLRAEREEHPDVADQWQAWSLGKRTVVKGRASKSA